MREWGLHYPKRGRLVSFGLSQDRRGGILLPDCKGQKMAKIVWRNLMMAPYHCYQDNQICSHQNSSDVLQRNPGPNLINHFGLNSILQTVKGNSSTGKIRISSSNTRQRKFCFLIRVGDEMALGGRGKISQAALFSKITGMEVNQNKLSSTIPIPSLSSAFCEWNTLNIINYCFVSFLTIKQKS